MYYPKQLQPHSRYHVFPKCSSFVQPFHALALPVARAPTLASSLRLRSAVIVSPPVTYLLRIPFVLGSDRSCRIAEGKDVERTQI